MEDQLERRQHVRSPLPICTLEATAVCLDSAHCPLLAATMEVLAPRCDVCWEDPGTSDLLTNVCSATCSGRICRPCFVRHMKVTLVDNDVPGILPYVRCPMCTERIPKRVWRRLVHGTADGWKLLKHYAKRCYLACSFQAPCCHNPNYSHLPPAYREVTGPSRAIYNADHWIRSETIQLTPSLQAKLPDLQVRLRAYCTYVSASPRALVSHIFRTFGARSHSIFQAVVRHIHDEERRASLMLCFYAQHKITRTLCCDVAVCFNCKRCLEDDEDHVDCDEGGINEDQCLLQCRSCRIVILKVEGCDALRCLCGFEMSWNEELALRAMHRRCLIPVDIADLELVQAWYVWRNDLVHSVAFEFAYLHIIQRFRCVDRRFPTFRSSLTTILSRYLQRRRFQRRKEKDEEALWREQFQRVLRALQPGPLASNMVNAAA